MHKTGRPFWGALCYFLAAAAAVVSFAAVVAAATAASEQQDQDDDPPAVVTTKAIVTTHNEYLHEIFSSASPLIPWYSASAKRCGKQFSLR
jgi:hypothetical protein